MLVRTQQDIWMVQYSRVTPTPSIDRYLSKLSEGRPSSTQTINLYELKWFYSARRDQIVSIPLGSSFRTESAKTLCSSLSELWMMMYLSFLKCHRNLINSLRCSIPRPRVGSSSSTILELSEARAISVYRNWRQLSVNCSTMVSQGRSLTAILLVLECFYLPRR